MHIVHESCFVLPSIHVKFLISSICFCCNPLLTLPAFSPNSINYSYVMLSTSGLVGSNTLSTLDSSITLNKSLSSSTARICSAMCMNTIICSRSRIRRSTSFIRIANSNYRKCSKSRSCYGCWELRMGGTTAAGGLVWGLGFASSTSCWFNFWFSFLNSSLLLRNLSASSDFDLRLYLISLIWSKTSSNCFSWYSFKGFSTGFKEGAGIFLRVSGGFDKILFYVYGALVVYGFDDCI